MKQILVVLLLILLLPSKSFADNGVMVSFPSAEILNEFTARIPFKLIDHLIVVEAELYDKKGNFIIDTGSETLILNKQHFKATHKKKTETYGVNGLVENPLERSLQEFILKNFNLKNITSDVIDLSHIEKIKKIHLLGIIGHNILRDYEVFIDMHLNQITLTKVDRKGEKYDKDVYLEKIVDSLPFRLKKHTIVVNANISGYNLRFGLDTAAEYNQLSKHVHKDILKNFQPKRHLQLTGASNITKKVFVGNLHRVKFSKTLYCGPMLTAITNFNRINQVFGIHLDGLLGYEFLRQHRTVINYQKEMLYFVATPLPRY